MTAWTPLDAADKARLAENLGAVRARIARACAAVGRDPGAVQLVAVSKYGGPAVVAGLLELGQRDFGENRVQHLLELHAALADHDPAPRWHMIGHLQRNKAKQVADVLSVLHSLDSLDLARLLAARRTAGPLPCFVQVQLHASDGRSGLGFTELPAFLRALEALPGIDVRGLMGLPPEGSAEDARPHFRRLAEALPAGLGELSMGMTGDLEVAIAEGSTCVRVGRALYAGLSGF
ncbi:MAG: YggS family pyridoxal phosphate-dependent enzyme [Planctomycetes bacterium]|nr:YggS family pyridoxal phosphate-dependent enzyme [Planctomycetota bacterium]